MTCRLVLLPAMFVSSLLITGAGLTAADREATSGDRKNISANSDVSAQMAVVEDGVQLPGAPGEMCLFRPRFLVFFNEKNPTPALRYANIPNVPNYNVLTWGRDEEVQIDPNLHIQDGFDPKVDRLFGAGRTANVFSAAPYVELIASKSEKTATGVKWQFPAHTWGQLEAEVTPNKDHTGVADLRWTWRPAKKGYFSIGYVGAPAVSLSEACEIWQPMIWNDLRFPSDSFLTPAFLCPLPGAMVNSNKGTITVMAASEEFPFQPMPTQQRNNPFGIALRDREGLARPMIFAPILGGEKSLCQPDEVLSFHCTLHASALPVTSLYEEVARNQFGFRDVRENRLCSMNETLDRMLAYGMSHWSEFNSDLRGSEYSTDVPGAVKNVSPIAPLGAALVVDQPAIFRERALPTLEYVCSREKFLFAVSPKIKVQSPSWRLNGPASPPPDLISAYGMSQGRNPALVKLSAKLLETEKVFNLDTPTRGDRWQNYLALFRANNDPAILEVAIKKARAEIAARQQRLPNQHEPGSFFWPSFTAPWIDYLELYEETRLPEFLEAAHDGARHYTMFCWMCPQVPDERITVDQSGRAPRYRTDSRYKDIRVEPTEVEAWQVSEIGLTPESAGTCKGHRAILNAHYAPFMARIGWYAKDPFLIEVARWAVIGRYRNFPGYHMNTARTAAFMSADFPLRPDTELNGVTSIHYNHIWSHIGLMIDSLVTEAFVRSEGKVDFPSQFTEGYAYLQSKAYGDRQGRFYGDEGVWLWMPEHLLRMTTPELNYLTARKDDRLYVILMNESSRDIREKIILNPEHVQWKGDKHPQDATSPVITESRLRVLSGNGSHAELNGKEIHVSIPSRGHLAFYITGIVPQVRFQNKVENNDGVYWTGPERLDVGETTGMMFSFGPELTSAYVYLESTPDEVTEATLIYHDGQEQGSQTDKAYPFEFTVPVHRDATQFRFSVRIRRPTGETVDSSEATLERRTGVSPVLTQTRLEMLPRSSVD